MLSQGQMLYREYLKSEHWKVLRLDAFKKHGYQCSRCQSKHSLQPHHHIYRHPWESCTVDDLEILCQECHRSEHGIGKPKSVHSMLGKSKRQKFMDRKEQSREARMASLRKSNYGAMFYRPKSTTWENRGSSSN